MKNNLYEVKLKMIKEMKDNLTSKLRDYTIATSILAATALSGCATTHQQVVPNVATQTAQERGYSTIPEAMKVLDTTRRSSIKSIGTGYKCSIHDQGTLTILAGLYAGTVKSEVKREVEENPQVSSRTTTVLSQGSYSYASNPEPMNRVLKDADINNDLVISRPEVKGLINKLYQLNRK